METKIVVVSRSEADGNPILHMAALPSFTKEAIGAAIGEFYAKRGINRPQSETEADAIEAYNDLKDDGYWWDAHGFCFSYGEPLAVEAVEIPAPPLDKAVAVKCEGCFTEWYSPNYKEPYNDNAEYRDYCDLMILDKQPVSGPAFGDSELETLTDDLDCLTDRLCVDVGLGAWADAKAKLADAILHSLADGKLRTFAYKGMDDVRITPYTKAELPPVNEKSLEVYGEYKELVRARVAAI